jgi:hypothetical protein
LRKHASILFEERTEAETPASAICDSQGVAERPQHRAMTVQLDCPWCEDEVAFKVDETRDELVCSACGITTDFAPDSIVTYRLLYQAA